MPTTEAIIYEEAGADPAIDRIVSGDGDERTVFVAVPDATLAARVAAELADEGVAAIGKVPVGSVLYARASTMPAGDLTRTS